MALSWTRNTRNVRTASANGREYRILPSGNRFVLRINDAEHRFSKGGITRAALSTCLKAAEADARQHNKDKRTEGEQRPDPTLMTAPAAGTSPPSSTTATPPAPTTNHPGTGSPDPGDVTDLPGPDDGGPPDPPPTEGNVIFDSRLRDNGSGVLRPYVDTSPPTFITIKKKDPNAKPNAATLPKSAWIGSPPGSNRP